MVHPIPILQGQHHLLTQERTPTNAATSAILPNTHGLPNTSSGVSDQKFFNTQVAEIVVEQDEENGNEDEEEEGGTQQSPSKLTKNSMIEKDEEVTDSNNQQPDSSLSATQRSKSPDTTQHHISHPDIGIAPMQNSSRHMVGRQDTAVWPAMTKLNIEEQELLVTHEDQHTQLTETKRSVSPGGISPGGISQTTLTAQPITSNVLVEQQTDQDEAFEEIIKQNADLK